MSGQAETPENIPVEVLAGAALVGVTEGTAAALKQKSQETSTLGARLGAALIEPGDQRHIPHPWEQFKSRVLWTYNYLATPGDMNINHSPHPADTTMQLHTAMVNKTADTLAEKGLVEGVRAISAVAAGIAVGSADPLKKVRLADNMLGAANAAESLLTKPAIRWDDYAHLLGSGTQPPKLKPLRDFSDLMDYHPRSQHGSIWCSFSRGYNCAGRRRESDLSYTLCEICRACIWY